MLKAILASLTGFASDRTVMETAFALARIDAGHIEALHTRMDAAEVAAIIRHDPVRDKKGLKSWGVFEQVSDDFAQASPNTLHWEKLWKPRRS